MLNEILYIALLVSLVTSLVKADVSKYSVVWNDLLPEPGYEIQSKNPTYHNAMPIGNGHVGSIVNYESANDSIAVMIAASSSWGEDGETKKAGVMFILSTLNYCENIHNSRYIYLFIYLSI